MTDLDFEGRFSTALDQYKAMGLRSLIVLPMTTGRAQLGALGFGSAHFTNYDEETLQFVARVTALVALAVENSLTRDALAREEDRLASLVEINSKLAALNTRAHRGAAGKRSAANSG
jgi:GAF domain-containing protein